LSSAEFADLARIHPEAFTRQRALALPHRVSMRLKLRKGSIGDELDRFFEVLHDQPLADVACFLNSWARVSSNL